MSETVYKVVSMGLRSVSIGGDAELDYSNGKWVVAPNWLAEKGYHPMCFREITEDTYTLMKAMSGYIYEAEAEDVMEDIPPPMMMVRLSRREFTPRPLDFVWPGSTNGWPVGTVMAKRIRLMEEVKIIREDGKLKAVKEV